MFGFDIGGIRIAPTRILLAIGLFVGLLFVTRLIQRWLKATLLQPSRIDSGLANSIHTGVGYAGYALAALAAISYGGLDITNLAIVAGALSVGIGFGLQSIVNNFVSGLILLVERPIKVGDLVEVEGTQGWIESIGARSTVVRTFENTNIIVPNSTFLETNVVNWTLADPVIRSHVDVGVAYGSPVREVERLLQQVVEEHRHVLAQPEPFVRFMDFGDSALLFRAYFWLRLGETGDRLRIQSDLRFRIDQAFAEAGIVIAFPQRDVHLLPASALTVRIEESGADERVGDGEKGP